MRMSIASFHHIILSDPGREISRYILDAKQRYQFIEFWQKRFVLVVNREDRVPLRGAKGTIRRPRRTRLPTALETTEREVSHPVKFHARGDMRVPTRHPHPRHFATHAMPPRTRGAADADADADEIVIDDSPERPSKRTKPVQWRHRGVKSKGTCVFPGCNIPVDRGVGSHSAYPLFTEPVDARCCDRCSSRVVVDRAARTHPAFPLRECMHPADPGHSCAFTSDGSNMEKWKSWAIGPENGNGSDHDLRFESATSQLTDLIGKSGCLECAHQFLWRCKVISNKTLHRLACKAMVARVLIDYTRDEVRPAAVKAVFDDWWGSSSKFDLQSSMDLDSKAELVARLFEVIPESTFFKFIGALSEARVHWWIVPGERSLANRHLAPVIWRFKETRDAWVGAACFQIMLNDMNRELKLSKDSIEMKSMYVEDIAVILKSWLVQGKHAAVQRFIESKGIKLRGKSVLGEVADEINLPSVICDICRGDIVALNSNIKWFASLYHPSRGTAGHKWTSSEWSAQQALFECQGRMSDELILDAMELLITHFRPYAVNPCVFGRAILQALEEDQQLGFGNKLILLFLNNPDTRLLCTSPSWRREIREYFGDNISHIFVQLFRDETTPHKEFFSFMSHVFVSACIANGGVSVAGFSGDSEWRVDWEFNDMYRMLRLRPSDFAQEVREHENFWLKDDDGATRADKRAALQLAQSSIDKVKERMPDGIYKEVMDDLMNKWNDA